MTQPDATAPPPMPNGGGLRERKKAKTKLDIQRHALRLFKRKGFTATTIGEIAEAADVSPSTFFRYFPTKEAVVLDGSLDSHFLRAIREQDIHLGPFQAVRAAMQAVQADTSPEAAAARERNQLIHSTPDVRSAWLEEGLYAFIEEVADVIGERVHRSSQDPSVRTFAGALAGAWISAMYAWADDQSLRMNELLNEATRLLEAGLPL